MTGINTNTQALMSKLYGQKASQKMLEPMQRLSSGERINSAADDAAGLAVGQKMRAAIRSYEQGVKNSTNMISLLSVAEGALEEIGNMQQRLRELSVQSANGVYTNEDRDKMELELRELVKEMDRVVANTKFNGVNLLDGTYANIVQTGKDFGDQVNVRIDGFGSCDLGRYWEDANFENGDFEGDTTITDQGNNVYTIEGWEIHNVRVELGEDGSLGPTTINDRNSNPISNLIGGYQTPEDPTPRPGGNDIVWRKANEAPRTSDPPDSELPGTDDGQRPSDYGTLEQAGQTGFDLDNGKLTLDTGTLGSFYGYDVIHGPYVISDAAQTINAGEVVRFDWETEGAGDAGDVFAYLLNVDTGDTQILLDYTQPRQGLSESGTSTTTISTTGNYKFVFINGSFDESGGQVVGSSMSIDNIEIVRTRLPADQQHTICDISILTVAEAVNAVNVLDYALSQTSSARANMGAMINRLQYAIDLASSKGADQRLALSRVMDAEYSVETSKLAKQQILSQASMAMLAQATQSNNTILELIN